MDYGEIITQSARLVWKHRILWIFGLLAGLGGGSGNANLSYGLDALDFNRGNFSFSLPLQRFVLGLADKIRETPAWFFLMLFLLVCGLGLIFFLIGVFGRTALTRGAWQADSGSDHLGFGQLVNESISPFWRVAGVTLLVGLPGFAIALIFILIFVFTLVASFTQEIPGLTIILLCVGLPLVCLLVPFFWLMGIWSELSTVAIVGEERGVIDGLKRAWQLIRRNLGPVLLVAVLALVAQIGLSMLVGLIIAPIGIGVLLGSLLFSGSGAFSLGFFLPFLLVAIPLSLILGGLFQGYIGTLWTLVFRRLAGTGAAQPEAAAPPPAYPTVPPPSQPPQL